MTTTIESKATGIIKFSRINADGVKLYEARIETIWYDHSPRNPSLPTIVTYYGENSKPTIAYGLTYEEAIKHINSFGFNGNIENV